jgi:hypothetical protein
VLARRTTKAIAVAASVLVVCAVAAGVAAADGGPCQVVNDEGICLIGIADPGRSGDHHGSDGGGSGGSGSAKPCTYEPLEPPPPPGDPIWGGQDPAKGTMMFETCPPDTTIVYVPNGQVPTQVDPRELARRAIEQMNLLAPPIQTAPAPDSPHGATLGFPLWMWVRAGENTTGPILRTATTGAVSVTATAQLASVSWSMGDGHVVTCDGAGTVFSEDQAGKPSPSCGYVYQSLPSSGRTFPVTANARWHITWSGGGQTGTQDLTLTSTTQLPVREIRALNGVSPGGGN